jgi:hypothetical protein
LPHRFLVELAERMKQGVTHTRGARFGDIDVVYNVYKGDAEITELVAGYDESGTIFVVEDLVRENPLLADLTAYHEYLEIAYKRVGNSHARAHRRAFIGELLAAKASIHDLAQLHAFLDWRIGGYPRTKVPDPDSVIAELENELLQDRVRKGRLLAVITRQML